MDNTRAVLATALHHLGWPPAAADALAEGAHAVAYEHGATVFRAGEPADVLYVLLCGEVKLYYAGQQGDRLLVGIVRSGSLVGTFDARSAVHDEEGKQVFSAQALSRCRVAIISRTRVVRALRELSPEDLLNVVGRTTETWSALCARFLDLLTMNVRSRLVFAIRELARTFGIPDARGKLISLKLSHEDFGDLVGASRPMVSKHLKELAKAGIFAKQNGRYVLWREDMLEAIADAPASTTRDPANLVRLHPSPRTTRTQRAVELPRRRASR